MTSLFPVTFSAVGQPAESLVASRAPSHSSFLLGASRMHKFSLLKSRTAAVVTGAVVVVGLGTTSGYAAAQITSAQIANNTIQAADIATDAIRSNEIADGTLRPADLGTSITDQLAQAGTPGPAGPAGPAGQNGQNGLNGLSAYALAVELTDYQGTQLDWLASLKGEQGEPGVNGTDGSNGADGASAYDIAVRNGFAGTEQEWVASLKGEQGDPASDRLGALTAQANSNGLVPIQKIGGGYSANATSLFTLQLPEAGTYLLNANGYFDRLDEGATGYEAPVTDTYLQLTVRGAGLGATCFTPAVSHKGFTETTCDASSVVTVAAPTTLTVRGFGYNEDRSGFGGAPNSAAPQFSVFAQLTAVKVG